MMKNKNKNKHPQHSAGRDMRRGAQSSRPSLAYLRRNPWFMCLCVSEMRRSLMKQERNEAQHHKSGKPKRSNNNKKWFSHEQTQRERKKKSGKRVQQKKNGDEVKVKEKKKRTTACVHSEGWTRCRTTARAVAARTRGATPLRVRGQRCRLRP